MSEPTTAAAAIMNSRRIAVRIDRRVRQTSATDWRSVRALEVDEEDMRAALILRRVPPGGGSGYSPGANRESRVKMRVSAPFIVSTPTTTSSAPDTPEIHA